MALWNSGATWNSGVLWGPAAPPSGPPSRNRDRKSKTMKRNDYYPNRQAEQPEWHTNFAAKLQQYGPALPLTTGQIANGAADNLLLAYGLGEWIVNVREFGPACTADLGRLLTGTGEAAFAFTGYAAPAAPALPPGADPVTPGALTRTFDLVQIIKRSPGYTEAIGLDMGVVGSEDTSGGGSSAGGSTDAVPRIKLSIEQGTDHQNVVLKFIKDGHEGVWIEGRRGSGGWEFLTTTTRSPWLDTRALLNATQAEVREYRARFWDGTQPKGDWCDVAKITVAP